MSLVSLVATWVFANGLQMASVPQIVMFSTAYALSTVLSVAGFREGGVRNLLLAGLSDIGLFSIFYLIFIF